ncbi:P-loop containing nucleoside triphosphate hydrolase protein [Phascolomyces articulosus]|uniref:DNA 3'-5' helicase n=1 Tax=Phascolomyces articulosus TaxID=60185 RepID=A0AAD5JWV1_9FUNG|nr:P-loop containing nucleoside triphosphate hydrolase protein [Phascolomyces articulosus]
MDTPFMKKLNAAQLNAATCKSNSVQILAGPGSGKTRVLTSRVAWLVLSEHVRPQNIVVVTFTNKAAKEMRHRLESPELLGSMQSDKLCMGTFHSICARLLRQYHAHVQLKPNFTIADTDMSRHAIKKLKEELIGELSDYGRTKMKPEAYFNVISKARNAGMNVDQYIEKNYGEWDKKDICIMFKAYEDRMHADNLVDFDNLLLYTRVLLARFPSAANFVSHVLVDEFQDTNVVQYDIVKGLTRGGKALTIVGDPDQSIFGWRNADRGNFIKMQREFKGTQICNLEENYRSTKHILKSAFHVVSKDKKRIDKSLFTENAEGVPMSMLKMSDDTMEAQSVAEEIKRIVEYSGSLITYKDIAILVRMNYLSRAFESALNSLSIPYVVIGGVKFFERAEVKDILAYLRFCYNANDTEAFERIINRPRRGVGEVTMNKIEKLSRQPGATIISVLRDISTGKGKMIASIPLKTKQNLAGFVNLYDNVQELMQKKSYIYRILEYIIGDTNYKEFLQKEHPDKDGESRWDNVGELVTFAKQFNPPPDNLAKNSAAVTMSGIEILENEPPENESNVEDSLPDLPNYTEPTEEEPPLGDDERLNDGDHIVRFLELTTLSTNSKEEDEADLGKVTISTMHSAKGLEWPVVFTIACEAGIIPHQKAEDDMEECRLLYVAMTRPKCKFI